MNIAVTSTYYMCTVENVFDSLHEGMRKPFEPYDFDLFDPTIEEVVPEKDMEMLLSYADAILPSWGANIKPWIDCDKVITICNFKCHWATLLIDLKKQKLWLYDSKAWQFEEHHRKNRRDIFLPMARIVPQILKAIGYFKEHAIKKTHSTHSGSYAFHMLKATTHSSNRKT